MNVTSSKKLALGLALVIGAFTATGCAVDEMPEEELSSSQSDALTKGSTGGGSSLGYTCTDAGFCQCQGLADCNGMFTVCKSHTYCNWDAQGYRCSCLDFVMRFDGRTGTTSPDTGGTLKAK